MKNIHTQESGRSMIEMLGVLAIIGVLSVGGIAGYSQAMSKFKVTKTTDQIQTMVTNIRTLFASQKTYKGINAASTMYSTGVFTDDNCTDGSACTTPINPYGGKITLATLKDDMGQSDRAFAVAYDGLPSDACTRLAIQDWGDASSGLIAVKAGSTNATIGDTIPAISNASPTVVLTKNAGTTPMALATAATGCGTSRGNQSSIILYYK